MSLFAEIMQAAKSTDAQNQKILEHKLPNQVLAEICGVSVRQIQRQRKFLKEAGK